MVGGVHTGYLHRMFLQFRREPPILCASEGQTGIWCVRRAAAGVQGDGQTTDITRLVVLEIADRRFAIEAVVVLLGELIVPRCAALGFCLVAEEPAGAEPVCAHRNVCGVTCAMPSKAQIR